MKFVTSIARGAGTWSALSMFLGGLLVAAGFAKFNAFSRLGNAIAGDFSTAFIVAVELGLAAWLIVGIAANHARRAVILLFLLFFGISIFRGMEGHLSCGCFGTWSVSPWLMASFDLVILGALACIRPTAPGMMANRGFVGHVRVGIAGMLLAFACLTPVLLLRQTPEVGDAGITMDPFAGQVVVDPKAWHGKPFPLVDFIEHGDVFKSGDWMVVLYREDCAKCKTFLRALDQAPGDLAKVDLGLVALPPSGNPVLPRFRRWRAVHARMDDSQDWQIAAPSAVRLLNGIVVAVASPANASEIEALLAIEDPVAFHAR